MTPSAASPHEPKETHVDDHTSDRNQSANNEEFPRLIEPIIVEGHDGIGIRTATNHVCVAVAGVEITKELEAE